MSSEQESKPQPTKLDERRAKLNRLLTEYPAKLGIKIRGNSEVERFLNLTTADLRSMSAEDCGEAAYIIAKSMAYIQLEHNRIQADIDWCEEYTKWLIAKTVHEVGSQYLPFEFKRVLAIQQNDVAMQLQRVLTDAKAQLTSISYIADKLRTIVSTLEGLQQTKRNQK